MKKYKALLVNRSELQRSFVEDLICLLASITKEKVKGIQIYNDSLDKLNLNSTQKALVIKVYHMTDKGAGLKDIIKMLNSFSKGTKRIKSNRWDNHHEMQYEFTEKDGNEKYSHKGNIPNAHFRWDYGQRYTLSEEDLRKISLFIKPLLKHIS